MKERRLPAASGRRGSALVIVLLALLLLSAIGAAMVVLSTTDTLAAANQRDARAVLYAAESAVELAADELVAPRGLERRPRRRRDGPSRVDGPPSGARQLPDGRSVLLEALPNLAELRPADVLLAGPAGGRRRTTVRGAPTTRAGACSRIGLDAGGPPGTPGLHGRARRRRPDGAGRRSGTGRRAGQPRRRRAAAPRRRVRAVWIPPNRPGGRGAGHGPRPAPSPRAFSPGSRSADAALQCRMVFGR